MGQPPPDPPGAVAGLAVWCRARTQIKNVVAVQAQFTAADGRQAGATCSSRPRSSRAGTSTRSPSRPAGRWPRRSKSTRRRACALRASSGLRFRRESNKEPALSTICTSKRTRAQSLGTRRWSWPRASTREADDPGQGSWPGVRRRFVPSAAICRFRPVWGRAFALPGEAGSSAAAAPRCRTRVGASLALAFLGGLILNLMPCVLPVISLKILSFVEQAGESRGRVFALNVWYSLGPDVGVHGAGRAGGRHGRAWPGASSSRCPGSKSP